MGEQKNILVIFAVGDRKWNNGLKLQRRKFRLDVRKSFLIVRIAKHWNKLPRKMVESPSLEGFNSKLDKHLSGLVRDYSSLSRG